MKVAKSANMNTCEVPQMICEEESGQHLSGETFCSSHFFTIIKVIIPVQTPPVLIVTVSNSFWVWLVLVFEGAHVFAVDTGMILDKIMLTWKKGGTFLLYFLIAIEACTCALKVHVSSEYQGDWLGYKKTLDVEISRKMWNEEQWEMNV